MKTITWKMLVLMLAAVGLAALCLGCSQKVSRPEIYWNLERWDYMKGTETGLSTRKKGEDGLFHVKFALEGQQKEYAVESKRNVDMIDMMDAMGLVLGENGAVEDILPVSQIATVYAEGVYVRSFKDGVLTVNPSAAMDGADLQIQIGDAAVIYDCTASGAEGQLRPMDMVCVYGSENAVTHIFIAGRQPESRVYWRMEQKFDAVAGQTARRPDAAGVYTIAFVADGQQVELKCKDKTLVNAIDGKAKDSCAFAFQQDEDGYITRILDPGLAVQGPAGGAIMNISGVKENALTVEDLMPGNGQVADYRSTITGDTEIYDVSQGAEGQKACLQVGDSIFVLTDTEGAARKIFITNRGGGDQIDNQGKTLAIQSDWDNSVISGRQDVAEDYMRKQVSLLWRAEEDITYNTSRSGVTDPSQVPSSELIHIKKGRIYSGVIYSYSYTTMSSFLEYAGEPDGNGVYSISGLPGQILCGGSNATRMGNDCSSAVVTAWSQFGTTVTGTYSRYYIPSRNFVPLGNFVPLDGYDERGTAVVKENNNPEVMYESYAKLKKADALVRQNTSNNHAMMVVSVNVVRNKDLSIDPIRSTVTILEQTSSNVRSGVTREDPVLGDVYIIGGADVVMTFEKLLKSTYLPYTCRELRCADPVEEMQVQDTLKECTKQTLFTGTISSNRFIGSMNITITDKDGKVVQQASLNAMRTNPRVFEMERFLTDDPQAIRGSIDLAALSAGEYRCTVVCRLSTEEEVTVREFNFTA